MSQVLASIMETVTSLITLMDMLAAVYQAEEEKIAQKVIELSSSARCCSS